MQMTVDERRSVERLQNVFVALVEQEWKKEVVLGFIFLSLPFSFPLLG